MLTKFIEYFADVMKAHRFVLSPDRVQFMLQVAKIDPNLRNDITEQTYVQYACERCQSQTSLQSDVIEILRLYLQHPAFDVNQLDEYGFGLIHTIVNMYDSSALLECLLQNARGLNINLPTNVVVQHTSYGDYGETALHIMFRIQSADYIPKLRLLLAQRETNVDFLNSENKTPLYIMLSQIQTLHYAQAPLLEIVEIMLKAGANPNIPEKRYKRTPFQVAACIRTYPNLPGQEIFITPALLGQLCDLLLNEGGADPYKVDEFGQNAIELATRRGNEVVLRSIEAWRARKVEMHRINRAESAFSRLPREVLKKIKNEAIKPIRTGEKDK